MKIERWQDVEDEIREQLGEFQKRLPLTYHRFYDTRSAGDAMPAQPADFLVLYRGRTTLIEAKFSEVHESLRSCFGNNVGSQQLASARIWGRAGGKYLILFYPLNLPTVEVWDGLYCADCRSKSKRLAIESRSLYPSIKSALEHELGWDEL